jgi:hypothetical protein
MHDILYAVSTVSGVSVLDILSHRRRQEINLPRIKVGSAGEDFVIEPFFEGELSGQEDA